MKAAPAARSGGECGTGRLASPEAQRPRLPATRIFAALVFLLPGGLLLLAGLALLTPWLRRLPAVLDRMAEAAEAATKSTSRQPDRMPQGEPSKQALRYH